MIRSMTGYGKAMLETPQRKITVEVRSLNSKQADINVRLPMLLRERELDLRNMVMRRLTRGKVDLTITFDSMEGESATVINTSIVRNYFNQLKELGSELDINDNGRLLSIAMRLPETLSQERTELTAEEWERIAGLTDEALTLTDHYRQQEGTAMAGELTRSTEAILVYLERLREHEGNRITRMREKLTTALSESPGTDNIDMNRFEQELIFYLEKLDINEEKVRLKKHCDYFLETMKGEGANGKMLNFISQEMGREINTIGSKANDAAMQKLVVMMKDELEKIKELTLNIL